MSACVSCFAHEETGKCIARTCKADVADLRAAALQEEAGRGMHVQSAPHRKCDGSTCNEAYHQPMCVEWHVPHVPPCRCLAMPWIRCRQACEEKLKLEGHLAELEAGKGELARRLEEKEAAIKQLQGKTAALQQALEGQVGGDWGGNSAQVQGRGRESSMVPQGR